LPLCGDSLGAGEREDGTTGQVLRWGCDSNCDVLTIGREACTGWEKGRGSGERRPMFPKIAPKGGKQGEVNKSVRLGVGEKGGGGKRVNDKE